MGSNTKKSIHGFLFKKSNTSSSVRKNFFVTQDEAKIGSNDESDRTVNKKIYTQNFKLEID
jgi:hypothetical protein